MSDEMTLGLERGVVHLHEYDPAWAGEFVRERSRIRGVLGDVAVEHVGSTAVEGLCAKPIIDILVGIDRFEEGFDTVPALKSIGYLFLGECGVPRRHYFRRGDPTTHHLHMVVHGSRMWLEHMGFRDILRNNRNGEKEEYERIKRGLAKKYVHDREAYTSRKAEFIEGVLVGKRRYERES